MKQGGELPIVEENKDDIDQVSSFNVENSNNDKNLKLVGKDEERKQTIIGFIVGLSIIFLIFLVYQYFSTENSYEGIEENPKITVTRTAAVPETPTEKTYSDSNDEPYEKTSEPQETRIETPTTEETITRVEETVTQTVQETTITEVPVTTTLTNIPEESYDEPNISNYEIEYWAKNVARLSPEQDWEEALYVENISNNIGYIENINLQNNDLLITINDNDNSAQWLLNYYKRALEQGNNEQTWFSEIDTITVQNTNKTILATDNINH